MTTEVSALQAGKAEKVYSQDGILYSGMSIKEADNNPEKIKIFEYADRNEDGIISDIEFNRYNAFLTAKNSAESQPKEDKKDPKKNMKALGKLINVLELGFLGGLLSTAAGGEKMIKGIASKWAERAFFGGIITSAVAGALIVGILFTLPKKDKTV